MYVGYVSLLVSLMLPPIRMHVCITVCTVCLLITGDKDTGVCILPPYRRHSYISWTIMVLDHLKDMFP